MASSLSLDCCICLVVSPLLPFACILFFGPVIYFQGAGLNSNALTAKYVSEGDLYYGAVVKRWEYTSGDHGTKYFVLVSYTFDACRYTKKFQVFPDTYGNNTIELLCLPDYPRSAILRDSAKHFDKDFPPSKGFSRFFGFFWSTIWTLIPTFIILNSVSCSYCGSLLAPVFFGAISFEYFVGYFIASHLRDRDLWPAVYGAKLDDQTQEVLPRRISYKEFCDEETQSYVCIRVIGGIFKDLFIALCCIPLFLYFSAFLGAHLVTWSLLSSFVKPKLFAKYRYHDALSTIGNVVTRGIRDKTIIVSYEVNSKIYKKKIQTSGGIPDEPELVYLSGHPKSAELKCQVETRSKGVRKGMLFGGLFILTIQVFLITLIWNSLGPYDWCCIDWWITALVVATMSIAVGFMGSFVQYHFLREQILSGAREIPGEEDTSEIVDMSILEADRANGITLELAVDGISQSETEEYSLNRFKALLQGSSNDVE